MIRGGTHARPDDGVRDFLDCDDGRAVPSTIPPGVDELKDCEILIPAPVETYGEQPRVLV